MLAEDGCKEIVLTGVNLSAYGRDLRMPQGLATLVRALLHHTDVPRLRLSSLEPWGIDESFLRLWQDPRLCRQMHLPLQAGYDNTLRRMGRPISTAGFARLLDQARNAIAGLSVTTDLIAGFPGEDEPAFRASYDFVASLAFARVHVFTYSDRRGTPASRMSGRVSAPEKRARAQSLRALGHALASDFQKQFVGSELPVLWEQRRADGRWSGLTDNYLRVAMDTPADLHNTICPALLTGVENGHLIGQVCGRTHGRTPAGDTRLQHQGVMACL
jgi:threonylcarbamoyladenosine tRNA methylthiotransferase MtaB